MKTRLIRIGNARGILLPEALIREAGLTDEVELSVRDGAINIEASADRRAGWAAAARECHKRGEDQMLDPPVPTAFDRDEWEW